MNIEVTKKTFEKIFSDQLKTPTVIKNETHEKNMYFNEELDQVGFSIFNYVSLRFAQYYLEDINS